MIHLDATIDECMEEISVLEREIEWLRTDYSTLKKDYDAQRTEFDNISRDLVEVCKAKDAKIEQLWMVLRDLVNRWSTKRGFDSAIQRARRALEEKT
jgi:hypothetical protein